MLPHERIFVVAGPGERVGGCIVMCVVAIDDNLNIYVCNMCIDTAFSRHYILTGITNKSDSKSNIMRPTLGRHVLNPRTPARSDCSRLNSLSRRCSCPERSLCAPRRPLASSYTQQSVACGRRDNKTTSFANCARPIETHARTHHDLFIRLRT